MVSEKHDTARVRLRLPSPNHSESRDFLILLVAFKNYPVISLSDHCQAVTRAVTLFRDREFLVPYQPSVKFLCFLSTCLL